MHSRVAMLALSSLVLRYICRPHDCSKRKASVVCPLTISEFFSKRALNVRCKATGMAVLPKRRENLYSNAEIEAEAAGLKVVGLQFRPSLPALRNPLFGPGS